MADANAFTVGRSDSYGAELPESLIRRTVRALQEAASAARFQ
jgi:hypothetical protein